MMDYKGHKCAACHKLLTEHDDIVICPECGAPYHRECYAKEGRCVFSEKHKSGFEYVPPEAKPDVNSGADCPICPACHAQNPPDTLFCEHCGQPLPPSFGPQMNAGPAGPQYNPQFNQTPSGADFQYAQANVMNQLHLAKEYDGISTTDWMEYIGNSAPYYLYQFQTMNETGKKTSFCWSAVLLPEFYFFYRKMWGWGALAALVMILISIPSMLSMLAMLGVPLALPLSASALSAMNTAAMVLNWGLRICAGLFAFHLYRKSAAKQILTIRARHDGDEAGYRTELHRRSGPSRVSVVVICAALIIFSLILSYVLGPQLAAVYF